MSELLQTPLIPMSPDELEQAWRRLASQCDRLRRLREEHRDERLRQKQVRDELQNEIDAIARSIREQGR